jgi:hypothetical protein
MLKITVPSVVRMLNVCTVNFKINKYASKLNTHLTWKFHLYEMLTITVQGKVKMWNACILFISDLTNRYQNRMHTSKMYQTLCLQAMTAQISLSNLVSAANMPSV